MNITRGNTRRIITTLSPQRHTSMDMHSRNGNGMQPVTLNYNQPIVLRNDQLAICPQTHNQLSMLRITNLSREHKATFMLVSGSEWDGTYTLPIRTPDNQWTCTTNFIDARLTVTNLSPGAASIEVMLLDIPGNY